MLLGRSNFDEEMISSAVDMLKDELPGGWKICSNVERIYSKIIEERVAKNGKKFSKEKWYLVGCDGASYVFATLRNSRIIQISQVSP
ncbi:hypothetical protein ACCI51_01200 [Microbulbifer echini]|uniref:Uncharacterized protein n=1 Tax=Microbulbifer echini TaxID=1529067 RepID=A0ABV4NIC7_9GAMM|nr:hypothetical protein [uncultured Microbulbifer sp.]